MIIFNYRKPLEFQKFPNGEILIKKEDVQEIELNEIIFKFETNEDIFNLILLKTMLKNPTILKILYLPYSRMDRENNCYIFTLKYIAKILNSLNFKQIIIGEPHSDISTVLLENSVAQYYTTDLIHNLIHDYDLKDFLIMFPDIGASKRYSSKFYFPYITGHKNRDFETGNIINLEILEKTNIEGKNIVIVDDLCSKGGTFLLAAEKLKQLGVNDIYLIVGHCENTIFDGKLLDTDLIKVIYTTNSILTKEHEKIKIKDIII